MSKTICTECPERCILTETIRTCAKIGSKIWLDRNAIICRTCPKIEETCTMCTREGNTPLGKEVKRDELGKGTWDEIAGLLWNDYLARHPDWKKHEKKNV